MARLKKTDELVPKDVDSTKILRGILNQIIENQNALIDIVGTKSPKKEAPAKVEKKEEEAGAPIKALLLSKELEIDISKLKEEAGNIGIEIKSHLSNVTAIDADKIREVVKK